MRIRAVLGIAGVGLLAACNDAPPPQQVLAPVGSSEAANRSYLYCPEETCWTVTRSEESWYDATDCRGTEYHHVRIINGLHTRRTWDGGGLQGDTRRSAVIRSVRATNGVCRNTGSTAAATNLVITYRPSYDDTPGLPCEERLCMNEGVNYSYFTNADCSGYEFAMPAQHGYRTWDGQGLAGTVSRVVVTLSRRYGDTCQESHSGDPKTRVYRTGTYWGPPPSVGIVGPTQVAPWTYETWTASVSGGYPPYTYHWLLDDLDAGSTTSTYSSNGFTPYQTRSLAVMVSDARGAENQASINVIVSAYTDCEDPNDCYTTSKRTRSRVFPGTKAEPPARGAKRLPSTPELSGTVRRR